MTLRVDTGRLRRAGNQIRASALELAPGPAAGYSDGLGVDDAGGSGRLATAAAEFAGEWRAALVSLAATVDQVGVLAAAAAAVYDARDQVTAEAFGPAGDGVRGAAGGRS